MEYILCRDTFACDRNFQAYQWHTKSMIKCRISILLGDNVEFIATFNAEMCGNYSFSDSSCQLWPKTNILKPATCFGKQWLWCRFLSDKIVLELCPILNESGVDNWHRRNGSWKAYFTLCQLGRQILIHPKSAYPIYISKGSNPFNFHEIGCLLEGDLDTWSTRNSPIGFWLEDITHWK